MTLTRIEELRALQHLKGRILKCAKHDAATAKALADALAQEFAQATN